MFQRDSQMSGFAYAGLGFPGISRFAERARGNVARPSDSQVILDIRSAATGETQIAA